MAWTESRSRDEWLAEVKRRGERIRRRRRMAGTIVTVLALFMPLSALAGYLTAEPGSEQELSVAGPAAAPAGAFAPQAAVGSDAGSQPPLPPVDEPAVSTTTTIETVLRRAPEVSGPATVTPPASTPGNDNPVVARATTTTAVADGTSRASSQGAPQAAAVPPPPESLPLCTQAEVTMTLKLEKDSYGAGEIVRGSAAVEPRPGVRCRILTFSDFQILNSAGKDIMPAGPALESGSSLSTGDDGGPAYSRRDFAWEAIDCTPQRLSPIIPAPGDRTGCVPFPSGRYTVVALWEDGWMPNPVALQLTT